MITTILLLHVVISIGSRASSNQRAPEDVTYNEHNAICLSFSERNLFCQDDVYEGNYMIEESSLKFTTSSRGKVLILLEDYKFYRLYTTGLKSRWRCSTHNSKGCKAFIHTIGDEVFKVMNVHNHPPPRTGHSLSIIHRNGGKVLLCKGYQYHKHKDYVEGSSIWKCSKFKPMNCRGTVTIKGNLITKSKPHISDCRPDYHQNIIDIEIRECKRKMLEAMRNNKKKLIPTIYENTLALLQSYGIRNERIPPLCAVRKVVYYNLLTIIERKGGKVLLCNGYQYYKRVDYVQGSTIWRCSKFKMINCRGTVTTLDNDIIKSKPHATDCAPDYDQNFIDIQIHDCKRRMLDAVSKNREMFLFPIYENTLDLLKSYGINEQRIPPYSAIKKIVDFNIKKATL